MEKLITKEKEFKDLVHIIRGQQVMLDSDLACLYGTEVKKLNQQVKRNKDRFPNDFAFQITRNELDCLVKSHFVTSPEDNNFKGQDGGRRKLPYVFTEQGVYMVATILKNDIASQQSVFIMRSFKRLRHYITENQQLLNNTDLLKLSTTVMQNKEDIQNIKDTMATTTDINKIMDKFIDETNIKEITFLEGQRFEANEAYINIYKQAKHTIYVMDNYVDFDTLSLLKYKQRNVAVTIFTANKNNHKLHKTEVDNFCREYPSLNIIITSKFHDRYIILDYGSGHETMYHCGHSSKDTGKKVSTIHKMLDTEIMHPIVDSLLK